MQTWQLEKLGGALRRVETAIPEARPGTVVVRVEAVALLTYMKAYVEGRLAAYSPPDRPFTPGTNAIATIHAVGRDVYLQPGTRVYVSPHLVASENIPEPAQILLGLTALSPAAKRLQADWPDGLLADYAVVPARLVTPCDLSLPPAQLAITGRFAVPYGGLVRGRLVAGETVVVTGATGAFGGAAVHVALALGAGKVIAAGRNRDQLARLAGPRVETVVLTGEQDQLRDVRAHLAFDMVGNATDPRATLAALYSLRRNGRLVLMGSMSAPLPLSYSDVLRNNWEILGQFMYAPDAFRNLFDLARVGLLDLGAVATRSFPMAELPAAMEAAASTRDAIVMVQ